MSSEQRPKLFVGDLESGRQLQSELAAAGWTAGLWVLVHGSRTRTHALSTRSAPALLQDRSYATL